VAKEAGVSLMTVSAVLRTRAGDTYPVAAATRERVLAAARTLNYFPSAVAQGMRGQRINTIGVVLINPHARLQSDWYVCCVLDGIIAVANAARQNTTLFTAGRWSSAEESLSTFCDGRTDGLIILSPAADSDIVPSLLEFGLPFVLVNGHSDDPRVSSVDIDHRAAMEALAGGLIAQGHRRIAYLPGRSQSQSARLRQEGYERALQTANLPLDPDLVIHGHYSPWSGYDRARQVLEYPAGERPTALCCGNDQIAFGVLRALHEAGLRIPEDMSVTGFDDMMDAATQNPPLTTVRQPLDAMGQRAAEILLTAIETGAPHGVKEVLPTEVIWRSSVAPPSPLLSSTATSLSP